jgi:glycosyltransferase involved in cell wall biosynthesis
MPNVVLEAMACERPVLLTPFEGQSNTIGRPGIEFMQSDRSSGSLAKNLAALLDDHDRCDDLVRHGKAWVTRNLSLERSLDRFADFYHRALAGPRYATTPHEVRPALFKPKSRTQAKTHPTPARVQPS